MRKFRELINEGAFNHAIDFPSVSVSSGDYTFELKFDSKDIVQNAGYTGPMNPWLTSLCQLIMGKSLDDISTLNQKDWDQAFKKDQFYWDLKHEEEESFFNIPLELLKASLDLFRGRDYLYKSMTPLVCRCFGVREADIIEHLSTTDHPTVETLALATKAGMGCRSCLSQIKPLFEKTMLVQAVTDPVVCRCLSVKESEILTHIKTVKNPGLESIADSLKAGTKCKSCVGDLQKLLVPKPLKASVHFYKDRPISEWILEIDYMISCFPQAHDWKMEIVSMRSGRVTVSFDKNVSQIQEEKVAQELQDFLGASLDKDLAFFLRSARHFANAKG